MKVNAMLSTTYIQLMENHQEINSKDPRINRNLHKTSSQVRVVMTMHITRHRLPKPF